jgi:hypothetical protein
VAAVRPQVQDHRAYWIARRWLTRPTVLLNGFWHKFRDVVIL